MVLLWLATSLGRIFASVKAETTCASDAAIKNRLQHFTRVEDSPSDPNRHVPSFQFHLLAPISVRLSVMLKLLHGQPCNGLRSIQRDCSTGFAGSHPNSFFNQSIIGLPTHRVGPKENFARGLDFFPVLDEYPCRVFKCLLRKGSQPESQSQKLWDFCY